MIARGVDRLSGDHFLLQNIPYNQKTKKKDMSFNIHTFKKVIAGKFALLMMFFLAQAVSAMADTKLYMEDFSIAASETKEVALILQVVALRFRPITTQPRVSWSS